MTLRSRRTFFRIGSGADQYAKTWTSVLCKNRYLTGVFEMMLLDNSLHFLCSLDWLRGKKHRVERGVGAGWSGNGSGLIPA